MQIKEIRRGFFNFFNRERERDYFVNQSAPLLFVYFGSVPPFDITNGYRIISQKCLIEHNLSFILWIAFTTHVRHFPPSPPHPPTPLKKKKNVRKCKFFVLFVLNVGCIKQHSFLNRWSPCVLWWRCQFLPKILWPKTMDT